MFCDYRVILVENDSLDGTREVLLAWSASDSRVTVLSSDVGIQRFGPTKEVVRMRRWPTSANNTADWLRRTW